MSKSYCEKLTQNAALSILEDRFNPTLEYNLIIDSEEVVIVGFKDEEAIETHRVSGAPNFYVSEETVKEALYTAGVYEGSVKKSISSPVLDRITTLIIILMPLISAVLLAFLIHSI